MSVVAISAKVLYTVATVFTRLGLLVFYRRLVGDTGFRAFKWLIAGAIFLNFAILIVFVVLSIWLCQPASDYWEFGGQCLDEGKVILGGGISSTFADLVTTALPIPLVMKIQMPFIQRAIVILLLSLGFLVTIAGAVR
jgi:hypothetical protein